MSERVPLPETSVQPIPQTIRLVVALVALAGPLWIPAAPGLSVAGHRMLALLVFSVILWMTEGVSYPVSGMIIATFLMTFLVGASPRPRKGRGTL